MSAWSIEQENERNATTDATIGMWSITLETKSLDCFTLPVWFYSEADAEKFLRDEVLPVAGGPEA